MDNYIAIDGDINDGLEWTSQTGIYTLNGQIFKYIMGFADSFLCLAALHNNISYNTQRV